MLVLRDGQASQQAFYKQNDSLRLWLGVTGMVGVRPANLAGSGAMPTVQFDFMVLNH